MEDEYMIEFFGTYQDYEDYPNPELAKLIDNAKADAYSTLCCACDGKQYFAIPGLCLTHFNEWLDNRKKFEKLFFNGKEKK